MALEFAMVAEPANDPLRLVELPGEAVTGVETATEMLRARRDRFCLNTTPNGRWVHKK